MNITKKVIKMANNLWDIEKEFESMKKQMDNLMNRIFTDSVNSEIPLLSSENNKLINNRIRIPSTEIYETDDEYVVKLEIPGVKKEDIKLEVKNGVFDLRVKHKTKFEDKDEKKGYHKIEINYSDFVRNFSIPEYVDETKVNADYKNGILEVHIQKKDKHIQNEKDFIEIK
jgi:HSP20 family protein